MIEKDLWKSCLNLVNIFLIMHRDNNDIGERIDNISAKDVAILVEQAEQEDMSIQI